MRTSLLDILCRFGVELLGKTVRIRLEDGCGLPAEKMAGYWHGDSVGVMLLLRHLHRNENLSVTTVTTADRRGDIIEGIIRRYGADCLRVRDGTAARHSLRDMQREAENRSRVFALALDGPTGPYHKPKRLLSSLARRAGRESLFVQFEYSAAIRLNSRWDRYAIPLPFSRILVRTVPADLIYAQAETGNESAVFSENSGDAEIPACFQPGQNMI